MKYLFSGYLNNSGANYGFKTPVFSKNSKKFIQILGEGGYIAAMKEFKADNSFEEYNKESPNFFLRKGSYPISCLTYNDICYVGKKNIIFNTLREDSNFSSLPLILKLEYLLHFNEMKIYFRTLSLINNEAIKAYFENKGKTHIALKALGNRTKPASYVRASVTTKNEASIRFREKIN